MLDLTVTMAGCSCTEEGMRREGHQGGERGCQVETLHGFNKTC